MREGARGAQMRPLVWRTMKAILSSVTSSAAMMRSPSFSREGESRTIMKWPDSVIEGEDVRRLVVLLRVGFVGAFLGVGLYRDKGTEGALKASIVFSILSK